MLHRPRLLHRIQTYLTPGFNVHPRPGVTLRTGLPVPVTEAKTFDFTLHGAVVGEF